MNPLTRRELTRIEFLLQCGVSDDEIIEEINSNRAPYEEDCTAEVDFYINCILEQVK
jgi:hypothetical protein